MQANSSYSRLVRLLSLLCAAVLLVSATVRALLHLHDLTGIRDIAGIWMALAQYSDAGVFYPPLESDGLYAGTRYMPLCFGLIAGLVKVVGNYLVAAKLMALVSMTALLSSVFLAVRWITGRTLDAVILTGLVLASPEGLMALLSPHADALSAALTVAGLLVIQHNRGEVGRACLAALFFTAAFMTKVSALAGLAAASAFLLQHDRKRALWLLLSWLVLTAAGLILLQHFSAGRFLDNFRSFGSGGMSFDTIRIGPSRLAFALGQTLPSSILIALAVLILLRHGRQHGFDLWDWYFLAAGAVTLVIYTSPGTDLNHLLELEIAAVLLIARMLAQPIEAPYLEPVSRGIVLAVLLGGGWELIQDMQYPNSAAAVPGRALVEALPADTCLLAEDATVPVLLGQRPVVMDTFAFRVLAEHGRIDDHPLAARIERREFDVLALMGRVDRPGESLCPRFHFGPRVTAAMRQAYRFDRQIGPYYLFVPSSPCD